jgi:uncharacterized DUF497 family protein
MGSEQSQTKSPEAPGLIPRSGNRIRGMSNAGRVLIITHADRNDDVRIISARKTTLRERKQYEEKN